MEGWERDLCVSETELVEKFVHMLQRREADLKMLGASSVEQLFSGHNKKTDLSYDLGMILFRGCGVSCQCQIKNV